MYKHFYRRNLPHQQPPGAIVFVTANLSGCLPKSVQLKLIEDGKLLKREYGSSPPDCPEMIAAWKRLFAYADKQLDRSKERWYLKDDQVSQVAVSALYKGVDMRRFVLHRYCIMPNHLHLLIEPLPQNVNLESMDLQGDWPPRFFRPEVRETWQKQCLLEELQWAPLAPIMKAIKSVTALEINKKYKLTGAAWHRESFDHWVRNGEEYCRIIDYRPKSCESRIMSKA